MADRLATGPARLTIGAAVRGRCPQCGSGKLFRRVLTVRDRCSVCMLDFKQFDLADGPAVFAITFVGFIVVAAVLVAEIVWRPPIWLHALVWIPLATALCVALLRPLKAVLLHLEYANSAREGRWDKGKD